ncbi:MAG: pseudaminic acid synthase [Alphaproteobacteria bacterium]|nr:pseudaminic acid synthase [Alphaproteobacteria bacterium]
MSNTITLGKHSIGQGLPPFIIAEMSGNHNGSLDRALAIVDAVAQSGAHALKLQTYTADSMTLDSDCPAFRINDINSPWHGRSLYSLYQQAATPWEWHAPIFERARAKGLVVLSSPFDEKAADFLHAHQVDCYKIASFENIDLPLIKKVATLGKPVIISTGLASEAEIEEAVTTARNVGCKKVILLKCTSTYPASPTDSNLRTIEHMRERFQCEVGLSDHTIGMGAAIASVAMGATVIEKHVTLQANDGGVDSAFSIDPQGLAQLVAETAHAAQAVGEVFYGATKSEQNALHYRRSLYVRQSMQKGELFSPSNIRAIRPNEGLPPKYIEQFIGKSATQNIARGTPLEWKFIEKK